MRKRGNDVVAQKINGITFLLPAAAIGCGKCGFEGVERPFGNQMAFHLGNVGGVTRVAELFIEYAQKHLQDGVAVGLAVGLGVDVEQDHIGRALHRALDVGQQHGVLDLLLVKELAGPTLFTGLRIVRFEVFQQIGKDLDEVRFA